MAEPPAAQGAQAFSLCENCGKPVAASASLCPNCGALNISAERQRFVTRKNRTWITVLGALVGCSVLFSIALFLGILAICSGLTNNYH
ncbi:MAG: zinc-ribbon domain-containing protein [Candidatus Eremiobacteraeota bacterium]|nr:zinc-ribbon domain-containing protein [Candidatus Eremiobacteraeota bacterium]MBV8365392.1 zinc-ribbon domain-containing protein [Candidatus Eremiobacteraeota bacterium]